jgi:hypothetical protein
VRQSAVFKLRWGMIVLLNNNWKTIIALGVQRYVALTRSHSVTPLRMIYVFVG